MISARQVRCLALVVAALVGGLTWLALHLVRIQLVEHETHLAEAVQVHTKKFEVPARRGDIVDCAGQLLATSVPLKTVQADLIKLREILKLRAEQARKKDVPFDPVVERSRIASLLAPELGVPVAELSAKLAHPTLAVVDLKRRVEVETWEKIEALKLPAITSSPDYGRRYPAGRLAVQTIGYVDGDHKGRSGVEAALDGMLTGTPGRVISEQTRRGHELPLYRKLDVDPRDGNTLVLTLDSRIQMIVEEETDRLCETNRPKAACVVVMRPGTGEILAMVSRPTGEPPEIGAKLDTEAMRNRCVSDSFEPGSTFKIVTIAAALNERLATLQDPVFCENGVWFYAGRALHDHGSGYGTLTVEQILQKSSNIGFAKLALRLGAHRLYQYAASFGFGQRVMTGTITAEQRGVLRPVSRWNALSITRIPMGHEVTATPVQMASAMCAVVNGGSLMKPQLVREVRAADGTVLQSFQPQQVRQVISPAVSRQVTDALVSVVSAEGTARQAHVPGFVSGGKTGTTQKWDNEAKSYRTGKYVASFIGFLPADDPQFVICIMVDEPRGGKYYGGEVAAPFYASMAKRIAQHMDLMPEPLPAAPAVSSVRSGTREASLR